MGKAKTIVRKATFEVTGVKNERVFTPVNKRAKKWARSVGKRTRVTVADLKEIKRASNGRVSVWASVGIGAERKLKAIKV